MANPFVHLELNTPDLSKAKKFYGDMFGWQFQDMDMGGSAGIYSTFKPETGPGEGHGDVDAGRKSCVAGVRRRRGYRFTASTEKAKSLGATVCMGPQEIPNVGWFSMITDPTGCTIAMFQPK